MIPEKLLPPKLRNASFVRLAMEGGMTPLRELRLSAKCVRFGKAEKLNLSSVPDRFMFVSAISSTVAPLLHLMPTHLQ
ncbi:hypothetical protein Scep_029330 [Stephania cephalantha]|uniref:Uncharacterized protein n=1 Tax=Stephania cephalantha TaxID=152367 RepID=A0AAP0HDF5_9MAGN